MSVAKSSGCVFLDIGNCPVDSLKAENVKFSTMCDELKLAFKQTLIALDNAVDDDPLYDEFTSKGYALLRKFATDEQTSSEEG